MTKDPLVYIDYILNCIQKIKVKNKISIERILKSPL